MYKIRTFNAISNVIRDYLPADKYEIVSEGDDFDAAIVRSASLKEMDFAPSVRAIARAGAGYNNIPVDRCTEQGIVVFNTPGANANAVREMVLAGLLLGSRKIGPAMEWVKTLKGKGAEVTPLIEKGKGNFAGPELRGKKLGVIGLGNTGRLVANSAQAIGMLTYGYDPYMSVSSAWGLSRNVQRANSYEEIVSECDYISIHIPYMDSTKGLFGDDLFNIMKPGACLLNFSRGEIVDPDALMRALDGDRLRCYVTDFPFDEIIGHEKVVATPHLAASTPESEENCAAMAAAQIRDYLENGIIANSVNFPACDLPRTHNYRIAVLHNNVSGMVSGITTLLSNEKINIANMINKSRNNVAITIIDMDEQPPQQLVGEIEELDGVITVYEPKA